MNKSQLRRLAAEHADGRLPADEYRRRRRELIDAIIGGQQAIRREKPPAVQAVPPERDPATSAGGVTGVPWHLVLGGAAAVCVLALVWLLWPGEEPAPGPVLEAPAAAVPPVAEVPRSRTLVESFLALRDFGAPAIAGFRDEWGALSDEERDEARETLWFRSLVRALRDEIKTQMALAGLPGSEAALARARSVWDFGEYLQVTEQLPGVETVTGQAPPGSPDTLPDAGLAAAPAAPEPPTAAAQAAAPSPGVEVPAAASAPETSAPADGAPAGGTAREAVAAASPAPPGREPNGREWLNAQSDERLTLQLFAVNGLGRVEQLMSANPELPLRIVATDGAEPRYRVFHGSYLGEGEARAAFDSLPPDVSRAAGGAIVKSFAAVREDLAAREGSGSPAAAAPVPDEAPPADEEAYTLQLFASGNRDNAKALVDAFPALSLELHRLSGDASPYRVVYGRFGSPDDARAAASDLPGTLLSRIGKPLAKALAETGVREP